MTTDATRKDTNIILDVVNLPGKGLKKVFGLGKFVVGEVGDLATRTFRTRTRKGGDVPTKMKFIKRTHSKVNGVDPFSRFLEETDKGTVRQTTRPKMSTSVDVASGAKHPEVLQDYHFSELFVTFASEIFALKSTFVWKSTVQSFATNMLGGYGRRECCHVNSRGHCWSAPASP